MNPPSMQVAAILLLYAVLPCWIAAGFADYWCHRATAIERTSGTKESVLHLLQFGLIAIPTILALLMEINAAFFAVAIVSIIIHHAIAYIDVRYANDTRVVPPIEQMVHSLLELLPITALLLLLVLHWGQFLALVGLGTEVADFLLTLKSDPLPVWYVLSAIAAAGLFNAIPYLEELARCLRHSRAP